MAREYAKNWFSMWTDEDFCTGRLFDKLFYQVLIGQSGTNDAGICPINFRKWRKALRDGDVMPSELELKASLVRQERRRYVYTDEDTGEVLIRSHVRRDEVFKQPALMVSALRRLKACQSPKFAAVMLGELDRITLPEVRATTKQGELLRDSLKRENDAARERLQALAEGLTEPYPEPFTEDSLEPYLEPNPRPGKTEPNHRPSPEGSQEPPVVVEVEVAKSPPVVGHLGGPRARTAETVRTQPNPARNEPPPRFCPKHMPDGTDDNCGPCAGHRRHRQRWDEAHANDPQDARAAFWADVRKCTYCDEHGWYHHDPANGRCPEHDWENANA